VGAADYTNTPAFGTSPAQLESFSSTGYGSEFLFSPNGTPLSTPEVRPEPLFVGVDGDRSEPGRHERISAPFFGTSAAAPSVAGVAALMLQEGGGAGTLNPNTIYSMLGKHGNSDGAEFGLQRGNDGYGLVNGDAAVQAVQSAPKTAVPTATLSVTQNPFAENGGTTRVVATLSKPAVGTVTINLAFAGTATINTQYTVSSSTITIAPGQTSGSITITGVEDHATMGNETVIVSIFSITERRHRRRLAVGHHHPARRRHSADRPHRVGGLRPQRQRIQ
jgi:subtilisin family serine protease